MKHSIATSCAIIKVAAWHRIKTHPPGDVIYNIHKNDLLWDPVFPHPCWPSSRLGSTQSALLCSGQPLTFCSSGRSEGRCVVLHHRGRGVAVSQEEGTGSVLMLVLRLLLPAFSRLALPGFKRGLHVFRVQPPDCWLLGRHYGEHGWLNSEQGHLHSSLHQIHRTVLCFRLKSLWCDNYHKCHFLGFSCIHFFFYKSFFNLHTPHHNPNTAAV
jgi:hypothetical protein